MPTHFRLRVIGQGTLYSDTKLKYFNKFQSIMDYTEILHFHSVLTRVTTSFKMSAH